MKYLRSDFITAPTAWRAAIGTGKHDEMFLSTLPQWLLTKGQTAIRKINEMFQIQLPQKQFVVYTSRLNFFSCVSAATSTLLPNNSVFPGHNKTLSEYILVLGGKKNKHPVPLPKKTALGWCFHLNENETGWNCFGAAFQGSSICLGVAVWCYKTIKLQEMCQQTSIVAADERHSWDDNQMF